MTAEQSKRFWLERSCVVKLTVLELGALMALLDRTKREHVDPPIFRKPGTNGEPVPISATDLLIERVGEAVKELYGESST